MRYVIGVDEVHRGSLVGPVFAGACAMRVGDFVDGAADSKKLSESARAAMVSSIKAKAAASAVASASHDEIDAMNIKNATQVAMLRAVAKVAASGAIPSDSDVEIIFDGNENISFTDFDNRPGAYAMELMMTHAALTTALIRFPTVKSIVKADRDVHAVSCASILAKVEADEWLSSHAEAEKFGWRTNKGYGTKAHADLIRKNGMPSIYRKSFQLPGSS